MCDGPAGSLLVADTHNKWFKLDLDSGQLNEPKLIYRKMSATMVICRFHYVQCHDILLYTMKNKEEDKDYEITAVKLESQSLVWKLSGEAGGHIIKPGYITSDPEGNTYVSDRGTNRILKIDSLTGKVLRILLVDEREKLGSVRWSNTMPNLTVWTNERISTYFVPKH